MLQCWHNCYFVVLYLLCWDLVGGIVNIPSVLYSKVWGLHNKLMVLFWFWVNALILLTCDYGKWCEMLMELVPGVHMQYCCLVHGSVSVQNCLQALPGLSWACFSLSSVSLSGHAHAMMEEHIMMSWLLGGQWCHLVLLYDVIDHMYHAHTRRDAAHCVFTVNQSPVSILRVNTHCCDS